MGADHGPGRAGEHAEELDGGNVGAWREFAMPAEATLGEVYAQHVIPAAIECAREILARMAVDPAYRGVPLADFGRAAAGRHRPALRQDRLAFAWDDHPDQILRGGPRRPVRRAHRAGRPARQRVRRPPHDVTDARSRALRNADRPARSWPTATAPRWSRPAGAARCGSATPRSSRPTAARAEALAVHAVLAHLAGLSESVRTPTARVPPRPHPPGHPLPPRRGGWGWIHAEPYNGAASTVFCDRLLDALRYAANQDTSAIALTGGKVAFSNGIHLGVIEAAADPRAEAWANIQRIDDVAELVFNLARGRDVPRRQTTVAVLGSSAGAGGAVLSACFDLVLARPSINLNYHYGTMGLSGSELRSLVLPLRAGEEAAERLLAERLPVSPAVAWRLGLVDAIGPRRPDRLRPLGQGAGGAGRGRAPSGAPADRHHAVPAAGAGRRGATSSRTATGSRPDDAASSA